jgi:hypothetical protein
VNSQPGDLRLVALELPYFSDGNFEVLVPETYGDELKVTTPSGRRDGAPTVEEHLAQHPEARIVHDRIASVLPDHYPTATQISYRGRVRDRTASVIQLSMPQRRIYFLEAAIAEAGGDLKALVNAAQNLGFPTTPTSVEWPEEPGKHMSALVDLLADHFLPLLRRP